MLLSLDKIHKSFGENEILKGFSIEFRRDQISCLFGPSACGKTSILNIISKLQTFDKGSVSGNSNKRIAFIFQDNRLIPNISAMENVKIVCSEKDKKSNLAAKFLIELGLKEDLNKFPKELSGGACQRINIARALAYDADILLMDEPFSNLDPINTERSMDLIREYSRGKISVFVTHSQTEALLLSDSIYILSDKPTKVLKKIDIKESYEYRKKNKISFLHNYPIFEKNIKSKIVN